MIQVGDLISKLSQLDRNDQAMIIDECIQQQGIVETIAALAKGFCWERQKIAKAVANSSLFAPSAREIKTIGMFYHRFYNGGTENIMATLTDVFDEMGYQVVIFTDDEPNTLDYSTKNPHPRIVLPVHGEANSNYCPRGEALLGALREQKIDCFVWHAWMSDTTLWDMLIIKSQGIPFIAYTHSCFAFPAMTAEWLYYYDMPSIYSLMDAVVVLSRVDRAYWSVVNKNVHWLPQPLRPSLLKEVTGAPDNTELLWVNRLSYEKNYKALIDVMKRVHAHMPEARLTIVGKADTQAEEDEFIEAVKEAGLSEVMVFAGFKKDVNPYYEKASILVSTSLVEGFPLYLSEAKGFGVPSVIYDLPYLETVRECKGIVAIPFGESQSFADKLIELMGNKEARDELSKEARQSLVDYIDKQDIARDWATVFKSLYDEGCWQNIKQDDEPEETQDILWGTNNRYTEMGLRKYVQKSNHLFDELNAAIKQEQDKNASLKEEMKELAQSYENSIAQIVESYESSKSFRIGRAITHLPRVLREKLSR